MTRILVLGSSHAGTLRLAQAAIAGEHPGHEVDYFSVPGAIFARSALRAGGNFRPGFADRHELRLVRDINGRRMIALAPYERILVVGHRFALQAVLGLTGSHDIYEWPGAGRPNRISEAFLTAALEVLLTEAGDKIRAQFGADSRLTLAPAPYPCEDAVQPGPGHDRVLQAAAMHGDAALAMAAYEDTIARTADRLGYGWLPQPPETRAAPFLTARRYNFGIGHGIPAEDGRKPDFRHMNAEYGRVLFGAYAATPR